MQDELRRLLDASRQAEAERRAAAEAHAAERPEEPHPIEPPETSSASVDQDDAEDHPGGSFAQATRTSLQDEADIPRGKGDSWQGENWRLVASSPSTSPPSPDGTSTFRRADLSAFQADPDRFFEFHYRQTIRDMIAVVMDAEAPVREDVMARRIARAHGWLRTGSRIFGQILKNVRDVDITEEEVGRFLWKKDTMTDAIEYRQAVTEDDRRPVSEIALAELVGFVRANPDILNEADPALTFARLVGLERLAAASRARLEEAIRLALMPEGSVR